MDLERKLIASTIFVYVVTVLAVIPNFVFDSFPHCKVRTAHISTYAPDHSFISKQPLIRDSGDSISPQAINNKTC